MGKHLRAQLATVTVEENYGTVAISVTDDGIGFDAPGRVGRRGLLGMRERPELVGGTLAVESSRGAGAVLRACVPVRQRASRREPPSAGQVRGDPVARDAGTEGAERGVGPRRGGGTASVGL